MGSLLSSTPPPLNPRNPTLYGSSVYSSTEAVDNGDDSQSVESEHWAVRFTAWPSLILTLREVDAVMSLILHVEGQRFGGVK